MTPRFTPFRSFAAKILVAVTLLVLGGFLFFRQRAQHSENATAEASLRLSGQDSSVASSPVNDSTKSPISLPPADPAAALLKLGEHQIAVRANSRGEFSRVLVAPSALISAQVPFSGAQPGEALPIQTEDGGVFISGVSDGKVAVSDDGRTRFDFRAAATDGLNRITLRRGGETRVLEFWVGPEAPVLVRR